MTVPANFKTAINSRGLSTRRWLEIAGIPTCFGNFQQSSFWFNARAAPDQFLEIRPYFKQGETPANFDGELDPLEGIAKVMGQIEFSITDVGDFLTTTFVGNAKKADWVYLSADITATATTLGYTGSGAGFPASNGTLYIGAETIAYTTNDTVAKQFTGCTRAKYRSKAKAFGKGFPISPRAYSLKGRKAWYYQCAVANGGTYSDADKALRFTGTVEGIRLGGGEQGPGFYVLAVQSLEKLLSREVFRNLRTLRDDHQFGLSSGPTWTDPGLRPSLAPGGSSTSMDLQTPDYKLLADLEGICVRIEDEILAASRNGTKIAFGSRGLFGTDQVTHRPGFTAKEVAWVAQFDSALVSPFFEHAACRFNSAPTTASPLGPDHPLLVLLQIILSTGLGTNTPGGGARNYDVLPESWSLGIDYSRVDVAGIEKLASEFPALKVCGIWENAISFVDIAKEMLSPYGFYAETQIGDVWSIRYLRPPLPDEVTRAINDTVRISGQRPAWDGNLSGLVQEVVFKYGWDIIRRSWRYAVVETFSDAQLYSDSDGRRITFELPHTYPAGLKIPGKPPLGGMPNIDLLLKDRSDFYRQRYARPPPIIDETADYSFLDAEVGDLLSNTHSWLPNAGAAVRGLVNVLQQIIKKSIDDRSKTVKLRLLDTGYNIGDYRFISPSLHLILDDAFNFQVYPNDFTEPTLNGLTQNDMQVRDSSGALINTFYVGQKVRIWTLDFSASEHHTIQYFTPANIGTGGGHADAFGTVLALGLAGTEFFVTYDDYDTDTNAQAEKTLYGWLADSNQQLGAANDVAHKYFP